MIGVVCVGREGKNRQHAGLARESRLASAPALLIFCYIFSLLKLHIPFSIKEALLIFKINKASFLYREKKVFATPYTQTIGFMWLLACAFSPLQQPDFSFFLLGLLLSMPLQLLFSLMVICMSAYVVFLHFSVDGPLWEVFAWSARDAPLFLVPLCFMAKMRTELISIYAEEPSGDISWLRRYTCAPVINQQSSQCWSHFNSQHLMQWSKEQCI